jgi:lipopolysaccharide transport system permease protein
MLVLERGRADLHYWRDLWRYRELFYFLAWRDLLVRYKQTVLGVVWALLRPVLTMIAFVFVFGCWASSQATGCPTRSSFTPPCCRGSSSPTP